MPADTIYEVDITNENDIVNLNYCIDSTVAIHGCAPSATSNEDVNFNFGEVYPNPVEDQLIFHPQNNEFYDIKITSVNGKVVARKNNIEEKYELNTSNLISGIYFIQINSGMKSKVYKIVKK